MIAYCWASGQIEFAPRTPSGAIKIARGADRLVRQQINQTARLAYDGTTLLVPGIPEAANQEEAGDALLVYKLWLHQRERKGFHVAIKLPLTDSSNPFHAGSDQGHEYLLIAADDRIRHVQQLSAGKCRIALMLPDLQKTVRTVLERRLRMLEAAS